MRETTRTELRFWLLDLLEEASDVADELADDDPEMEATSEAIYEAMELVALGCEIRSNPMGRIHDPEDLEADAEDAEE
jgi:hypothetical protein